MIGAACDKTDRRSSLPAIPGEIRARMVLAVRNSRNRWRPAAERSKRTAAGLSPKNGRSRLSFTLEPAPIRDLVL
jgi:hypothetical protein